MYFNDDISQKGSFDLVSDYYERARPKYPLEVYSVVKLLLQLSGLGSNDSANILEVGSGSGQTTESLVDLGGRIDCIEPGKNFFEILNKKYSSLNSVNVHFCDFESFSSKVKYDLVFSGCAFHWINPEILFGKSARLINKNGWLVGIWHMPKFSGAVYEIIDKIVKPHVPEFDIPRGTVEQIEYFDVGIRLMLETDYFSNHKKIFFHSKEKLDSRKITDLIWSYVSLPSLEDLAESKYDNLLREISLLKKEELYIENIFPFAAGQRTGNV